MTDTERAERYFLYAVQDAFAYMQESKTTYGADMQELKYYDLAAKALRFASEYEKEIEDGSLLKLPCKPKDIVYFIGCDFSKCSAYGEEYNEASCQGCEVVCDSKKTYSVYTTRVEDLRWILQRYFDFGKTYFATPEAAQAALELRVK